MYVTLAVCISIEIYKAVENLTFYSISKQIEKINKS